MSWHPQMQPPCPARFRAAAAVAIVAALAFAATLVLSAAPPAHAATAEEEFGISEFTAGTCTVSTCTAASEGSELYTQAAGHPNYGITDFKFNSEPSGLGSTPIGNVKRVRVDLPAGLAVNPDALPQCPLSAFEEEPAKCEASTKVGEDQATAFLSAANLTITGTVYNLDPAEGLPAEFGVYVPAPPPLLKSQHVLLEGGVSWHAEPDVSGGPSGDYHEYFNIKNISNEIPLLESRLIFNGKAGTGFLTLPSTCDGPQITYMEAESYEGQVVHASYATKVGATGCEEVPFNPEVKLEPSTTQSDRIDGATVKVLVPQSSDAEAINSSTVDDVNINLPEGLTLNPAAAHGLTACTDAQFNKGSAGAVSCPASSQVGTVAIETPMLPAGSLIGKVYVGEPKSNVPSSGQEYRIFIDAEAPRFGVAVRLEGTVQADETTGRLTAIVAESPPIPFGEFKVTLAAGNHTPLANPLACGEAKMTSLLAPYDSILPVAQRPAIPGIRAARPFASFTVDFDGHGGACPSPLPFSLTQTASATPTTAGSATTFAFDLTRPEGQQYVSKLSVALPKGLLGKIPAVRRCNAANAAAGTCKSYTAIGTAMAQLGSGPRPYRLNGRVYLTVGYQGAPYGLSIVVPAENVGPFNYGKIITRARIDVDQSTAQVIVTSSLPTIVGGAPIRLRSIAVKIGRAGFMVNPTSCAPLATVTSLTSTFSSGATLSTPFQATDCGALKFSPKLTASSDAKTSRRMGASLDVAIKQGQGQSAIAAVRATLPRKMSSRLSTLNQACLAATFEADPFSCPEGSQVGGATVKTPVLPGKLSGPAYFVSHGGAAFPDLDLVLTGKRVRVILVGQTKISKGITHSNFVTLPDVPISSFKLKLPIGLHSALAAAGSFCKHPLHMPTTIIAQNGKRIHQRTRIRVTNCPIVVRAHKVKRRVAIITVKTPSAGRIGVSGVHLRLNHKTVGKAKMARIDARLSVGALRRLARGHRIKTRVQVRFVPAGKKPASHPSRRFVKLTFKPGRAMS